MLDESGEISNFCRIFAFVKPYAFMRHDHLRRELELLLLLTQNRQYTVDEVCKKLEISRRSFYYYIEFFEQTGFKVEKGRRLYSLSRQSWFFKKLYDLVQLTEDEVVLMRQLIEKTGMESGRLRSLHGKLDKFYDFKILEDEALQKKTTEMRGVIYDAIKEKDAVRIIGYSSPSSHTVKDRLVEPFLFLNNNKDVRCYEIESGMNKTFRLSRMGGVERLEQKWAYETEHRRVYVDLFAFSGEEIKKVTLLMGQLSYNVMLEEYPESERNFTKQEDGRWLLELGVCSYLGIGRFVLGLYDDIEILGDEGLKEYVAKKLQAWSCNLKK